MYAPVDEGRRLENSYALENSCALDSDSDALAGQADLDLLIHDSTSLLVWLKRSRGPGK